MAYDLSNCIEGKDANTWGMNLLFDLTDDELYFGLNKDETEKWRMCDIPIQNRLGRILNASYLRSRCAGDESKKEMMQKAEDMLFDAYSSLVERYEQIDISKIGEDKFKPWIISDTYQMLLGMAEVIGDNEKLKQYVEKVKGVTTGYGSDRYQLYRKTVNENDRSWK